MCLGIPARIVAITDTRERLGIAEIAGVRREVSLVCVAPDEAGLQDCLGAWVLVHVGFAMARIDEREAAATLALLESMGELRRELADMDERGSGAGNGRDA